MLGIRALNRIPAKNLPAPKDSYIDAFIFNILLIEANALVIELSQTLYDMASNSPV